MIEAVIYDMDGVLIDSEPFWREAEIKVFKKVNIELTEEMCTTTAGMRIDAVVNHWYVRFPWENYTQDEISEMIMDEMEILISEKGEALKGVYQSIDFFKSKGFPLAIASSSHMRLIKAVVKKLNLEQYFDVIYSAEVEEYGKPHPGVFISAAKQLSIEPENCVIIEDTFYGMVSGLASKAKVIAVPEAHNKGNEKFKAAHLTINSLDEINDNVMKQLIS